MGEKCSAHDAMIEKIDENSKELRAEFQGAMRNMEESIKKDIHGVSEKLNYEIKVIDSEQRTNREEFIETKTWVKSLFGQFEQVIGEVKNLTAAIQEQEVNNAVVETNQKQIKSFSDRIKDLSYEVIKWIVTVFILGGILTLVAK